MRWVERIDGISDFCSILKILDEISDWDDINASSKARLLTSSLTSFVFVMALHWQETLK
jgi:hypothetical protein